MSLTADIKNLYYSSPMRLRLDSVGTLDSATVFCHFFRAVLDGDSRHIAEPSPFFFPFNQAHLRELYWRALLFKDETALWLLKQNYRAIYEQ